MNTMRIAQAALATILTVGINSTTYAFVAVPTEESAAVETSIGDTVSALRAEIEAGETSCPEMLAKVNDVIKDIDAQLDAGVPNEAEYLAARKEVSKMRYELECLADKLAVDNGGVIDGVTVDPGLGTAEGDSILTPTPTNIPNASITPGAPLAGTTTQTYSNVGGGSIGGGSAGVGGNPVVGAAGTLGLLGVGLSNNNDNPGFVASESTNN